MIVKIIEEDEFLKENLIRLYYKWAPAVIKAMEEDEEFREEVKDIMRLAKRSWIQ